MVRSGDYYLFETDSEEEEEEEEKKDEEPPKRSAFQVTPSRVSVFCDFNSVKVIQSINYMFLLLMRIHSAEVNNNCNNLLKYSTDLNTGTGTDLLEYLDFV